MKKICFYIFFFLYTALLYPQDKAGTTAALTGFDGLQWGIDYKEAKERFRTLSSSGETKEPVAIIADTPDKEIKIQRNKLVYRYFFYQKPEILIEVEKKSGENSAAEKTPDANANTNPDANKAANPGVNTNGNSAQTEKKNLSRLFLVESTFPYLPAEELNKKITQKYGTRNGGSLDDKTNRGFYVWNLEKGYIIQWIDPYKKMPFTRSVYYVSKELIDEIKADFPKFQYSKELKILKDVLY
jgi:hypothetical protein